jgi:hypothetical protein
MKKDYEVVNMIKNHKKNYAVYEYKVKKNGIIDKILKLFLRSKQWEKKTSVHFGKNNQRTARRT